LVLGRAKDTIDAEGRLFEFLRGELLVIGLFSGAVEQGKEQLRHALKQMVEDGISFHWRACSGLCLRAARE